MNTSETYLLYHPDVTVWHEHNDAGMHRLIIKERTYRLGSNITTDWKAYDQIIVIPDDRIPEYRRSSICATTEYWEGVLPRVFRIIAGEKL